MKIKRKLILALVFLALMSSVAVAGVVGYRNSGHHAKKDSDKVAEKKHKPGECEYEKSKDGKIKWECED